MSEAQIKYMVQRFLSWRLPEDFRPDAGISFKPTFNEHMPFGPMKHEPTGTNLFDATQAEAMVRYMMEGSPALAEGHAAVRDKALEEAAKIADERGASWIGRTRDAPPMAIERHECEQIAIGIRALKSGAKP